MSQMNHSSDIAAQAAKEIISAGQIAPDEIRDIIRAAIDKACEETAEHFRRGSYAKLDQAIALVRTTQANIPPAVPASARKAVAKGIAAHRAAQATGEAKSIPLTQGKVAIVDAQDYETLSGLKWHCVFGEARIYYAATGRNHQFMHRLIADKMGITGEVDHIDGNPLNNRRSNLRGCTHSQNNANRAKSPDTTSQYKGVHWHKSNKAWEARIKHNKKTIHLGYFENEADAAAAYDKAARAEFGVFAKTNLQASEEDK